MAPISENPSIPAVAETTQSQFPNRTWPGGRGWSTLEIVLAATLFGLCVAIFVSMFVVWGCRKRRGPADEVVVPTTWRSSRSLDMLKKARSSLTGGRESGENERSTEILNSRIRTQPSSRGAEPIPVQLPVLAYSTN
ncbi:hypothetical protein PM082_020995 [Marasmius tenuissimus]|nr:hypothetical protein PM082_020995 [Marasmius tenuissimus]